MSVSQIKQTLTHIQENMSADTDGVGALALLAKSKTEEMWEFLEGIMEGSQHETYFQATGLMMLVRESLDTTCHQLAELNNYLAIWIGSH